MLINLLLVSILSINLTGCVLKTPNDLIVEGAVSMRHAREMVREHDDYYIIYYDSSKYHNLQWVLKDEAEKIPVIIIGHSPSYILGPTFLKGNNRYLVKGQLRNDFGTYQTGLDKYVWQYLQIDEWQIIAPVKRYMDDHYSSTPAGFDRYDVEEGDYIDGVDMSRVAVSHYKLVFKDKSVVYIRSTYKEDGTISWHTTDENFETVFNEVTLVGNSPEKYLSPVFLYESDFIITGSYDAESKTVQCERWDYYRLDRHYTDVGKSKPENQHHSRFYFDEADILNGDYFPNGERQIVVNIVE